MELSLAEGDVWWATPSLTVRRENAGRRPVVVVNGQEYHETVTTLVLAVPVTTTHRGWPNHVQLTGEIHLELPSWAMTEQVRAISRDRLTRRIGGVDDASLRVMRTWILDYLR